MYIYYLEVEMAHPEWALKQKFKGTELRLISNKYYLYRISSRWDKEKKRSVKITNEFLGRITEKDGLIPKGQRSKKSKPKAPIMAREYGATQMLSGIGQDIIQSLQTYFPEDWNTIYVLALQKLLYQAPLKNMDFLFQESYLSILYKDLNLKKNKLTDFMKTLGRQDSALLAFKKQFMKGSKHIVFDLTHIISKSKKMDINLQGYNSKRDFEPQINLFYLFSTDQQMPGYYRILPGNISGIKALKLTIDEAELKDCTVIGDKGFGSKSNIEKLEKEELNYILPLRRNSSFAKYNKLQSRDYRKAFDGHFIYQKRPIFYSRYQHEGRNCILFHDEKLRQKEVSDYLLRVEEEHENYSMDRFHDKQLAFGTLLMVTNLSDSSAQNIYEQYKTRMEVETMFDVLKNTLQSDTSYMQSNESFEAWMFINHIALLLYYRLYGRLKKANLLKSYSPKDVLLRLSRIQKIYIKNSWETSEVNSKTLKLIKKLELPIP